MEVKLFKLLYRTEMNVLQKTIAEYFKLNVEVDSGIGLLLVAVKLLVADAFFQLSIILLLFDRPFDIMVLERVPTFHVNFSAIR